MKVLVVVDMQNDFVDGALGTPQAQAIVDKVVEKIDGFDGDYIIATRDTHDPKTYLKSQEGQYLPIKHCIKGTKGWCIHDAVWTAILRTLVRVGSTMFNKDTFASMELVNFLIKFADVEQIEEITLVGLCTDICVVSNALLIKAFLPETKIVVDAACCAGSTPEAHEAALKTMRSCQINIENWEG